MVIRRGPYSGRSLLRAGIRISSPWCLGHLVVGSSNLPPAIILLPKRNERMIPEKIIDKVIEINSKVLRASIKRQFDAKGRYSSFFNPSNIMSVSKKDGKWILCLEPESFYEDKELLAGYPCKVRDEPHLIEIDLGEG